MICSLMMLGQSNLAEVSSKKAPSTHRRELAQDKPLQYFHGHTLQEITPTMIAKFRDWRLGAVQAGTVIKDLNTVSHIFTTAVREWGVEAVKSCIDNQKPKAPAGRLRFLTDGEM